MKAEDALKDLLKHIAMELVDNPEWIEVNATTSDGGNTIVLTLRTADGETGKVIGREGRNANALRTLLDAVAAKYRRRIVLEIVDSRSKGSGS